MSNRQILYIFLDEGGNLDFSDTGTKYFTLTSLLKTRPFYADKDLLDLKYDFIEENRNIEYFHASEDRQIVRDAVFNLIKKYLRDISIDSLIVEKRKTHPALQKDERFFPEMIGYLLPYVINRHSLRNIEKIIIFTDNIPVRKQRNIIEKAIKKSLACKLGDKIDYAIFHHSSKSNCYLQLVDYCNWAVYRKWECKDVRSYDLIKKAVRSEFDIFEKGDTYFY